MAHSLIKIEIINNQLSRLKNYKMSHNNESENRGMTITEEMDRDIEIYYEAVANVNCKYVVLENAAHKKRQNERQQLINKYKEAQEKLRTKSHASVASPDHPVNSENVTTTNTGR